MTTPSDPPDVALAHASGVSWPRSGHHLLVRLLTSYFGPAFVYCEFYKAGPSTPDPALKTCCGRRPCAFPDRVTLSKDHDFNLDTPQIPGHRYLVQYRAFTPSVVSNFELAVRRGRADTAESFRLFVSQEFGRYLGFTGRWVTSDFARGEGILRIPYEDLVIDPCGVLAEAARYLAPGHEPDTARLRAVVRRVDAQRVGDRKVETLRGAGVHAGRDVMAFRHYDKALFDLIDRLSLPRQVVRDTFERLLGRPPREANMLKLQTHDSAEALAEWIRGTQEYHKRQARA